MSLAVETPERKLPRWLTRHETLLAVILAIALVGLGAFNDRFLTIDNLLNQGRLMTEIGLIALPMTFIIITGGIDLSVGAIVGLCAVMLGYSWKYLRFPAAAGDSVRARRRRRGGMRQRPRHHPPQSAAADHDDRHPRALPRPRGRGQPGAFRARTIRNGSTFSVKAACSACRRNS